MTNFTKVALKLLLVLGIVSGVGYYIYRVESHNMIAVESIEELNSAKDIHGTAVVLVYGKCSKCQVGMPVFEKISDELSGPLNFITVNRFNAPDVVTHLGVQEVPTYILYRNGVEVRRYTGPLEEEALRAFLRS